MYGRARKITLDATLVVGITALITAIRLLSTQVQVAFALGVVCFTVMAWFKRCRAATSVGVFFVACLALVFAGVSYSQVFLGIGLLAYAVVSRRVSWLRDIAGWFRWGSFGTEVQVLTAASGLIAAVAIWIWYWLLQPNLNDIVQDFVPSVPLSVLIVGGVLFSMVNAAVEECAYRGVLLQGLDVALGRGSAALVLQAVAFGTMHVHGFPRGELGVGLAAIYGLLMGHISRRAHGMLAPWLAHIFTDCVIVSIILAVARPSMTLQQTAWATAF